MMSSDRLIRSLPFLILLSSCARPGPETVKFEGRTMGTGYHITIARAQLSEQSRKALKNDIDALLAGINKKMSTYDPDSELSRFNRSTSLKPFPVSFETVHVVRAALEVAKESEGAFDPTIGPLVDLWGFGPPESPPNAPGLSEIQKARALIGYQKLHVGLDPPTLSKEIPGLRVDLSAIAKGYGVDEVARLLSRRGFPDFLVEIGGEVIARGANPKGRTWRLGIDRPAAGARPGKNFSAYVSLKDSGLATSGDYRNYVLREGKRISHFIDPRTGAPAVHDLASASVIAPSCMEADAAATAVMVLGAQEGKAFLKNHPGWEALLITAESEGRFTSWMTEGFPLDNP